MIKIGQNSLIDSPGSEVTAWAKYKPPHLRVTAYECSLGVVSLRPVQGPVNMT